MKTVAFFVNPIAGFGGELGWKGTDDFERAWKQSNYKGSRRAIERAIDAVCSLSPRLLKEIEWVTAAGIMGEKILRRVTSRLRVVYSPQFPTTPQDTINFLQLVKTLDPSLIIFVGGDGTAKIVSKELKSATIPAVGIPAGVKITSGCFVRAPKELGSLIDRWLQGSLIPDFVDVMDLLESDYKRGIVNPILVGEILTLISPFLQGEKTTYALPDPELAELTYEGIAETISNEIEEGYWIIGPGSTTYRVMKKLGYELTPLGVDLLRKGKVIVNDANCEALVRELKNVNSADLYVLLTPIGGQGFLLGRGNQQICCTILERVFPENLRLIATPEKIEALDNLYIDVDCQTQFKPSSFVKVIIGLNRARMIRLTVL